MSQRGRGKKVVNTSKALELLDKDIEKYHLSQQKGDGKHITQTKYRHNTTQDMSTLKTIQKQTSFSQLSSSLHIPLSSSSKQATYKPILSSATQSFTRNPSKPNPQRKQTSAFTIRTIIRTRHPYIFTTNQNITRIISYTTPIISSYTT